MFRKQQMYIGIGDGQVIPFEMLEIPADHEVIVRVSSKAIDEGIGSLFPDTLKDRMTLIPDTLVVESGPQDDVVALQPFSPEEPDEVDVVVNEVPPPPVVVAKPARRVPGRIPLSEALAGSEPPSLLRRHMETQRP